MASNELDPIQGLLARELSELKRDGTGAVEHYKRVMRDLERIQEEKMKMRPPPATTSPDEQKDMMIKKALRQVGVAMPTQQQVRTKANGDTMLNPQGIFAETRKWHVAAAKVFEFCEAQLNMDLFKDDPEAKEIFEAIIMKGFQALHHEGGRGL